MKLRIRKLVCIIVAFSIFPFSIIFAGNIISSIKSGSQKSNADWPMWRYDTDHSGNAIAISPRINQTLWKFNTGGQVGSPLVVNGILYVGSNDNKVHAFRANDISQLWNYTTNGNVVSRPTVAEDLVFVGSEDYNLYALCANTGEKIWNIKQVIMWILTH